MTVFSSAAPGGTLSDDMTRTQFCLFTAQEDLETMQAYAQVGRRSPAPVGSLGSKPRLVHVFITFFFSPHKQVFNKLIRRYKYLEKGLEDEIKKVSLPNHFSIKSIDPPEK